MSLVAKRPLKSPVISSQRLTNLPLSDLPDELRRINSLYIRRISERSLLGASECAGWLEQPVNVFLRHDKVCVFAIVCGNEVGMADFVTIRNVRFEVDGIGRQRSNDEQGPLPNRRTIHAYLTGELIEVADHGTMPSEAWESIQYHPLESFTFTRADSNRPIWHAPIARLTPGKNKVWCPRDLPVSTVVTLPSKLPAIHPAKIVGVDG